MNWQCLREISAKPSKFVPKMAWTRLKFLLRLLTESDDNRVWLLNCQSVFFTKLSDTQIIQMSFKDHASKALFENQPSSLANTPLFTTLGALYE